MYEGEEPRRALGFPVREGNGRGPSPTGTPGAGGPLYRLPTGWFSSERPQTDLRWARHPVRWAKWRYSVHRLGPYAPDYNDPAGGPDHR